MPKNSLHMHFEFEEEGGIDAGGLSLEYGSLL